MAHAPSKVGDLIELFWSLLLMACIGLTVWHIVSAARAQSVQETNLIEKTFTPVTNER